MWSSFLLLPLLAAKIAADGVDDPTANAQLVAALRNAPTAVDRINILANDSDFVFDYTNPNHKTIKGAAGKIVLAKEEKAHYALGLLSVEHDLERLDLETGEKGP